MALRLAGERALVIQGTDNQGWVREVTIQDSLPGLKVNQKGAGRILDFQDDGISRMFMEDGGKVLLGNAANPPSPDALMHLWAGNAGSVTARSDAVLVIERGSGATINLLAPAVNATGILFGDPSNNNLHAIEAYGSSHASRPNQMSISVGGLEQLQWTNGVFKFLPATQISTVSGDLTLNPAGKVALGTGKLITGWSAQTTVGPAGAASAPPANPTGYIKIDVGSTTFVVPYYAAA